MYSSTLLALVVMIVAATASPFEIVEIDGEQYQVVPLVRQRRQTSVDVNIPSSGGPRVTLGHQGTIFQNDKHLVTGGAFASKQFKPTGPLTTGGNLGYQHIPSGSSVNLQASHTRGFGTDLSANANANLWRHGNSRLDAVGSYSRSFGSPFGPRPNAYGGLSFTHRF